ncbi:MAG: dockerin type I domain-containing protein, partial [Pirellulaceae bacterium]
MKNLRHMLRPTQWFGSSKRRQRPIAKPSNQRRLRSETLEKRELLAGDILASDYRPDVNPQHNGLVAVDTNADGWVTPGDILVVLNALAEKNANGGAQGETGRNIEFKTDVNNDYDLTPADALMVINDLNENGPHAA